MRTSHEKPRLPTNQTIDYCCNIGQIINRANLADDNYATGYVETNALGAYDSDSESDDCCKKYGFSRRRSVVECCDKHRYNRAIVLADVCRDSSRGVSGSRKNNQTTQLLPQQQVRTSTKTNGDMFGRKKQRSSWVSIPPPDADRSTEASSEARKTMDRLSQSSELHRDNAAKDIQRSSAVDRDVANTATSNEGQTPFQPDSARKTIALNGEGNRRDSRDTKKSVAFERDCCSEFNNTSNKAIKEENDVQPDSTRKMTTGNSDSKGRGTFGADERPFALDNRRDSDAREDTRRTSKAPAENESDVEEQAFETNVKAARESSVSDAEPCQSRSSADSHRMYEERRQSLNKRSSVGESNHGRSAGRESRRSSASDNTRVQRRRDSDNDRDTPTILSPMTKSSGGASKDVQRNPDSEEFVTLLENQAMVISSTEAENKFLKSELISVRGIIESLVEENSALHERLKHRLVDELLRTPEGVDPTQDIHYQGSCFVLSIANAPQASENNAALCRLLNKYDFQKVKKEFETIIRLHRLKSEKMEAQLKFSRSEVHRLEAEVTNLQRRIGHEESFLLVDKSTKSATVGLCVRCCTRSATVVSSADCNNNRQIRQLIKERDELMERVLSAKSVCSLAMHREANLLDQLSSFIKDFETAQLEVLEALRQRQESKDELNRIVESARGELHEERSCWKKQLEREQAESEERNVELVRKVEELLSELENRNRKLSRSEREKDMLQEKCDSINCRTMRIENDHAKDLEELKKSLCKMTQERDDAKQLIRMLEHQLIVGRTASDKECCSVPEPVADGVLEKFSSLEAHINCKVNQLQEYYGQALTDRDDVIQQQTAMIKKLKKKYCKVKRRLQKSRRMQRNTVKPESKNQPKKLKTDERRPSGTVRNTPSSDGKPEDDF